MKSGQFTAIGGESPRFWDPSLVTGYIGVAQFFVFVLLEQSGVAPFSTWLVVSLFVALASLGVLGMYRRRNPPIGVYQVAYQDDRPSGGLLLITYTNTRGAQRDKLEVAGIRADARHGIYDWRGRASMEFKGTKASLFFSFRKQKSFELALGFATPEAMYKIYEELERIR